MNELVNLLKVISGSTLPDTLKTTLTRIGLLIQRQHLDISTAELALKKIQEAGIHHGQCVVDNCRPSCPIRIAAETLRIIA